SSDAANAAAVPEVDPLAGAGDRRGEPGPVRRHHVRERLPQEEQLLGELRRSLPREVRLPAFEGESPLRAVVLNVSAFVLFFLDCV
ncbi:Rhomboid family, partial [Musa troglodytarum]